MSVAGGILLTFDVDTGNAIVNGIQVIDGIGAALIIQAVKLQSAPEVHKG